MTSFPAARPNPINSKPKSAYWIPALAYFALSLTLLAMRSVQEFGSKPTSKLYKGLLVATPLMNMGAIVLMFISLYGMLNRDERGLAMWMGITFIVVFGFDKVFEVTNNIKLGKKIEAAEGDEEGE